MTVTSNPIISAEANNYMLNYDLQFAEPRPTERRTHSIMLDHVFDSIVSILERSGYKLSIKEIDNDFLDFQVKADKKKYSNPELDPTLHDINKQNSFWIVVEDNCSEIIGTIAGRLCETNSFLSLCEYYEFWYGDKIRFSNPLNIVYEEYDRIPHGAVAYDGSMWIRPDHRNRGLSWALSRLCRLTAVRMWSPEWIFGFGFEAVTSARLPTSVYGYPRAGRFATGFKFPGHPAQTIYLATMTVLEAHQGASQDWQYLSARPTLVLDQAFANELRMRRNIEAQRQKALDTHEVLHAAIA